MDAKFSDLVGEVLTSIVGEAGDDSVEFTTESGKEFRLFHQQDCCESVKLEDIAGDLLDLIGSPILFAEERESNEPQEDALIQPSDSFTWTFYRIGTIKGTVVLRWLGESNGYYSEWVDFVRSK